MRFCQKGGGAHLTELVKCDNYIHTPIFKLLDTHLKTFQNSLYPMHVYNYIFCVSECVVFQSSYNIPQHKWPEKKVSIL